MTRPDLRHWYSALLGWLIILGGFFAGWVVTP